MASQRKPLRRIVEVFFILSLVACAMAIFQQKKNSEAQEEASLEAERQARALVDKTAGLASEIVKTVPVAFVEGLKIAVSPDIPSDAPLRIRLSLLNRQVKEKPQNTALLMQRAGLYKNLMEYELAEADLESALAIDPKHSGALYERANLNYSYGDVEAAVVDLKLLLSLEPNHAPALNNRAYFLAKLGRFEEALADALRSVELRETANSLDTLAYIYIGLGRHKEAVETYDKALKIEPEKVHALRGRAVAYRQLGEMGNAQADLDKQKSLDPDFCLHWELEPDPGDHADDKGVLIAE